MVPSSSGFDLKQFKEDCLVENVAQQPAWLEGKIDAYVRSQCGDPEGVAELLSCNPNYYLQDFLDELAVDHITMDVFYCKSRVHPGYGVSI